MANSKNLSSSRLLLTSLGSGFGNLSSVFQLLYRFDDTDGNSLSHIPDGKSSERGIGAEWLDAHWLRWVHADDGSLSRFDEFGVVFELLTGSSINLFEDFGEFAGDMGGVAIEDRGVTLVDFTRVVQDDDLSVERFRFLGGVVLAVRSNVTSSDVFDGDVLDVETDVVTRLGHVQSFVVHLDRFDFSRDGSWGKGDDHTSLELTGFNSADGYCSNTTNLVDVLEWESEGLSGGSGWWDDGVESLKEGESALLFGLSFLVLALAGPSFVPFHVIRLLDHVVSVPSRDGDESDRLGVVTDLLDVVADFLDDFVVSGLGVFWLGGVHLVDSDDELFHS